MSIILVLVIITCVLTFIAVGPILGRKLFPPPPSSSEFSVLVSYTHGLVTGQKINVRGDVLEVVKIEGNHVTFRQVSKK